VHRCVGSIAARDDTATVLSNSASAAVAAAVRGKMSTMLYFDCETLSTGNDGLPVDVVLAVTLVGGVATTWRETPAAPFTSDTAARLAEALVAHVGDVCTFNGAAFDFRVIAALLPAGTLRRRLVAKCLHGHQDIMFDFFTANGYFSSLAAFCSGCGIEGKTWSGAESAAAVREVLKPGTPEADVEVVMDRLEVYCTEDTRCLHRLSEYVQQQCCLQRTSKSGRVTSWTPWLVTKFRTVAECLRQWRLQPVDATWMETAPPQPHSLLAWIKAAHQAP